MLAILAFALTAGFSIENSFTCDTPSQVGNTTFTLKSSYPYREYESTVIVDNNTQSEDGNLNRHYSSGAEFFVAWGVLSMIYCIVAILVYILITANEDLARANNILIIIVSLWLVLCKGDMSVCNFVYIGSWLHYFMGPDVVYCISRLGC